MTQDKPTGGKFKQAERRAPRKITEDYLHNSGLYYLQRFAAGSAHFRRVMLRKVDRSCRHHADQDREACLVLLDALVEKFIRSGLLDDVAYVNGSVASHRRRGLSARAIEARMAAKGVSPALVKNAMQGSDGNVETEFIAALRLSRRKRLGPFGLSRDEPGQPPDKSLATLARAGFDYATASRALGMTRDEAEDFIAACEAR